ncbi:MAG: hypothetical protein HC794_08755 [Nitrospiraceae bacterium]|nr:hypothetical protein [Nitrospiraceae bacterium]
MLVDAPGQFEQMPAQRHLRGDLPGQDVQDDIGGVHAMGERLGTGGFDREQSVLEHGGLMS